MGEEGNIELFIFQDLPDSQLINGILKVVHNKRTFGGTKGIHSLNIPKFKKIIPLLISVILIVEGIKPHKFCLT